MNTPFRTIVVGIDFSDASVAALHEAVRLAKIEGGRVVAVEVVEREVLEEQVRFHRIAPEQAVDRIHAHLLRHLAEHAAEEKIEVHVVVGNPYSCLEEVCRKVDADLLVLGSRGWDHHPDRVGTVASKCVRRAPLPVMLVRRMHDGPFKKIAACTDFSDTSRLALHRAIHLAAAEGSSLDVIHVDFPAWLQPVHVQYDMHRAPDKDYQEQYRASLKDRLEQHVAGLAPPEGFNIRCHVLENVRAADAIGEFTLENDCDLIVLGTAGRTGLNVLLLGTTAERLIYRTNSSVLAIKPPQPAS